MLTKEEFEQLKKLVDGMSELATQNANFTWGYEGSTAAITANDLLKQPNPKADTQAVAMRDAITNVYESYMSFLLPKEDESWIEGLKDYEHLDPQKAEKILTEITRYCKLIKEQNLTEKLNAFLMADDYEQLSNPATRPVIEDLIKLVDTAETFAQSYDYLQLGHLESPSKEYASLDKKLRHQQETLAALAPNGANPAQIDQEISDAKAALQQAKDRVAEISDGNLAASSGTEYAKEMLKRVNDVRKAETVLAQKSTIKVLLDKIVETFNRMVDLRKDISAIPTKFKLAENPVTTSISTKATYFASEFKKNKGTLHKNGAKYNKIQEKLNALKNLDDISNKPDDIKKRLEELKTAAAEYIEERGKDLVKTNSKMRQFRLNYAQRIVQYCEITVESLEKNIVMPSDQVGKVQDKVHKDLPDPTTIDSQKAISAETKAKLAKLKEAINERLKKEEEYRKEPIEFMTVTFKGGYDQIRDSARRTAYFLHTLDELEKGSFYLGDGDAPGIEAVINTIQNDLKTAPPLLPDGMVKLQASEYGERLFAFIPKDEPGPPAMSQEYCQKHFPTKMIKQELEARKVALKLGADYNLTPSGLKELYNKKQQEKIAAAPSTAPKKTDAPTSTEPKPPQKPAPAPNK